MGEMVEPIRVVIADDHALIREGSRRILERGGNVEVVGEAADGVEAVALVERLRPDVIIMDIGMPVLNGVEATRRIKERHPGVGVLVLTIHDDDQYVFALLTAGAAGYLMKDVPGEQLIEAVRAVRAGEAMLHPLIARKVLARIRLDGPVPCAREPLTDRERQVLRLAARGLRNRDIATELAVSARTVQVHLAHVFKKLGVASRTEAVICGLRLGWFRVEDLG